MNRKLKNLLVGGPGSTSVGDIGLLILRVGVGAMMALGHGKSKMFGEDRFGPPEQLIAGVQRMGFPAPTFFAWMAALTEFAGGLLLAVGILTRPAAAALTFNMLVAALVAHASDPLFSTGAGPAKEPALLYAIPFLSLIFLGAGRYSVDGLLNRSR